VLRVPFIAAEEDRRGVARPVMAGFKAINSIEGGGVVKRSLRRGTKGGRVKEQIRCLYVSTGGGGDRRQWKMAVERPC
jgi:hypothetical protein